MPFSKLGLSEPLQSSIAAQNYEEPTAIQLEAIPPALKGKDILAIAKTGSGKTAAFVLPCLQEILNNRIDGKTTKHREPSVLIVVPTRELAQQVHQVVADFTAKLAEKITSIAIFGGVSINPQMQSLGKVDFVIATPGRLLDLLSRNALSLKSVSTFVLDEADKMLNLGFREEVESILSQLPENRQNLLFSATLNEKLTPIQQELLNTPVIINVSSDQAEASNDDTPDELEEINQLGYHVTEERKGPLLRYLIKHNNLKQVLVFASSAHKVDAIVDKLTKNRINASALHGKKSQSTRQVSLQQFKAGGLRVLVTTDLLARGIDINQLPVVINYELPRSPKDYIHRIGRTGRAGAMGDAISLVTEDELHHFKVIQKKMKKRITMQHSDDINLHGF